MSNITLEVVERYPQTNMAKVYKTSNGFQFQWNDWVLCRISFNKDNPVHWCLMSSFRGEGSKVTCTLINPTYERMYDFKGLSSLRHLEMVRVIEEVRNYK